MAGNPWCPTVKGILKNGGVQALFKEMEKSNWDSRIKQEEN